MKIFLVPNLSRPDALESAREIEMWFLREHHEVMWAHDYRMPALASANDELKARSADLILSLGGDGTLLRAARLAGYDGPPILGISYGHLGFLTSCGPEDLPETLACALAGELHVSRRATLQIDCEFTTAKGEIISTSSFALNDFAISRGERGDMIEFDIAVSGHHIDRLRGDGFVVSTATGSTGYALAAGGPIVSPEYGGMICVPVAPHTIQARAFLTSSSDVVEIKLSSDRPVMRRFFADGRPIPSTSTHTNQSSFEPSSQGVCACIRRGPGDIRLLDKSPQSFYGSVSRVFYGKVR